MVEIFLKIVNMSITSSILIVVVLLLCIPLKKAPKWISCLLWALAGVRLVCPVSIESTMSLIPAAVPISETVSMEQIPKINTGISMVDQSLNPVIMNMFPSAPEDSSNPWFCMEEAASCVWMAGMAAMMSYAVINCFLLYKKVKTSIRLQGNIWICDDIGTPFIFGIVRPHIYIPSRITDTQMSHVLAHEQAHLKRKDHWWKPLGFVVLSIHWFNPLVWIAYVMLCKDIELACDEKVIRDMGNEDMVSYAESLLSVSVSRRNILVCPLAFGEVSVKEQIRHVLNYKKPAFWIVVVSVIICMIVGVCFLTNPENKGDGMDSFVAANDKDGVTNQPAVKNDKGNSFGLESIVCEDGRYYLVIENEDVYHIEIITPSTGGGYEHADGSPYEIGEKVYLKILDGLGTLEGVSIQERNLQGEIVYHWSLPVMKEDGELFHSLDAAVNSAILTNCAGRFPNTSEYKAASFIKLGETRDVRTDSFYTITLYGIEMYMEANVDEDGIHDEAGESGAVALTFQYTVQYDTYELMEFWRPGDGAYYDDDIRAKFPKDLAGDALNSQNAARRNMMSCYAQIVEASQMDVDSVIEKLLDKICAAGTSSNPQDYIDKSYIEFRELIFYGNDTLDYRDRHANDELDLRKQVLLRACQDIDSCY